MTTLFLRGRSARASRLFHVIIAILLRFATGTLARPAFLAICLALLDFVLTPAAGRAATYTYSRITTNTSPGDLWSAGTNWSAVPVGAADTTLAFTSTTVPANGPFTMFTQNDLAGNFLLNSMSFNHKSPNSNVMTLDISGNALEFVNNGATTPTLVFTLGQSNGGSIQYKIGNDVILTNDLSTNINSTLLTTTLSGPISGGGMLTKGGTGTLILSGANVMSGGVNLNNGTLQLKNATALGTGTLTINGGTLDSGTASLVNSNNNAQVWNGDFTFGASAGLDLGTGAVTLGTNAGTTRTITTSGTTITLTVGGAIADGTTVNSLTKAGTGTLALGGANTFSGALTVNAGTLNVIGADAHTGATVVTAGTLSLGTAAVSAGSIQATSGITISGGLFKLDNTAGNTNRILDTRGINLSTSGEFNLTGNSASSTTETVGTLALGTGNSVITVASATGMVTTLAASDLTRSNRGTALVRGTNLNQTAATNVSQIQLADGGASLTLVGTNTLSGGLTNDATQALKIVPYLIGDGIATNLGGNFVTYDATLGLRVLTAAQATVLTAAYTTAAEPGNVTAGTNVTLTNAAGITVNSLLFNVAANSTLNSANANSLTVNSGAVASLTGNTQTNAIGAGFSTLNLDNSEGVVTVGSNAGSSTLTIATPIDVTSGGTHIASGALTKAGGGTLVLSATNLYTGVTTINQGTLQIGNGTGGNLAAGGGAITINPQGTLAVALPNGAMLTNAIVNNNTLTTATGANAYTLAGDISGTGSLTHNAANATLSLSGSNTYTGATTITNGTLKLASAGALNGTSGVSLGAGGIFDLNGQSISKPITGTSTGTITNTGGAAVITANVSVSSAATMTFAGTGDIEINGTYIGLNNSTSANLTGTNTVTLSGTTDNTAGSNGVFLNVNSGTLVLNKTGTLAYGPTGTGRISLNLGASGTARLAGTGGNQIANGIELKFTAVGGVFDMNGRDETVNNLNSGVSGAGTLTNNSAATTGTLTLGGGTATYSGVIQNGASGTGVVALTINGATQTLTGANTYTGVTTLTTGTLIFGSGALGSGPINFNGGTLQWNTGNTQDVSNQFQAVASGKTANLNTNGNDVTLAGVVTGAGGLAKNGAGTLTLSGVNSYAGTTTVNVGTLKSAGSGTWGNGSAPLTLTATAIADLNGTNQSVGSLTGAAGNLALNNGTGTSVLTINQSSATTYAGTLIDNNNAGGGVLAITKAGASTLTLTAANTYTGATIVNGGTLTTTLSSSGTPFGTGNITLNAGTMSIAPGTTGATSLTGASATAGSQFTYGGGVIVSLTKKDVSSSVTLTVGNAGAAAGTVVARASRGTLLVAPANGTAVTNLGVNENFVVNGGVATLNGGTMVPATILGRNSDTQKTGDFLTYGGSGFVVTSAYNAGFDSGSSVEIANVTSNTTLAANEQAYALRIGTGTTTATVTATGRILTIGNGVDPAGVILNGTSSAAAAISGGTLAFGTSEGVIYSDAGGVSNSGGSISAVITGSNGITVTGTGTTTLSNANNSFSGPINVNGTTLSVSGNGNLGNSANTITLSNGGTLAVTASTILNPSRGAITVSGGGGLSGSGVFHVSNNVVGTGTMTITGTVLLSGNNNFDTFGLTVSGDKAIISSDANLGGATSLINWAGMGGSTLSILGTQFTSFGNHTVNFGNPTNNGTLGTLEIQDPNNTFNFNKNNNYNMNSANPNVFITGQGTVRITVPQTGWNDNSGTAITFNGGALKVDQAAGGSMITITAPVAFGGGTYYLLGKTTAAATQALGNVTVSAGGGTIIADNNGGSSTTTINLGTLTTYGANGSALNIKTLNPGSGAAVVTTTTTAAGLTLGILSGRAVFNSADWATVTTATTNNVISGYTGYTTIAAAAAPSGTDTSNSLLDSVSGSSGAVTLGGVWTTNTLKIDGGSSLAQGGNALTITTGGLLFTGATDYAISGGDLASATATNSDLIVHQYGTGALTIGSAIVNGNGASTLTKSGNGKLVLATGNTYTGQTYVTGGTLSISSNNQLGLGTTGATLNLNGGTLQLTTNNVTLDNAGSNKRNVALGGNGGTFDVGDGLTLTVSGVVSGGGLNLTNTGVSGTGTLVLTGANTFSSGIYVNAGVLQLGNASAINSNGLNSLTFGSGTTAKLQLKGNSAIVAGLVSASANAIVENVSATAATFTVYNGANNTYAGVIQDGTGAGGLSFVKGGGGTLTLTGNNTYTGNTTVWNGQLQMTTLSNSSSTTVAGGALLLADSIRQNSLTLDGTAAANTGGATIRQSGGNSPGLDAAVSRVQTLSIANDNTALAAPPMSGYANGQRTYYSTLDLKNNDLIVNNATLADVTDMVRAGMNGTATLPWTGKGITSSYAQSGNPLAGATGLGVMRNVMNPGAAYEAMTNPARYTSFDGLDTSGGDQILVKYTWYGDFDLDGRVTSFDFALLDAGFAGTTQADGQAGWFFGDANLDGLINTQDFSLLTSGWNGYTNGGGTPLPEPATWVLATLGLSGLWMARRKRAQCRRG